MENKTGKYIKYAFGEIILVVIGILIALQINNWNEKRLNENNIRAILKELQNDLKEDILKSKDLISYYRNTDSIIALAQNNILTREDYIGDNRLDYINVAMNAFHLKIHTNGYQNLTDNLDDIPEKFREIIGPLNQIYTYNKYEIDKFDTRIDEITDRLMDKLAESKPWFYTLSKSTPNSAVHYFLNDSLYKNALQIYSSASSNLTSHVVLFNQNAVNSYRRIANLTGYPEELPDFIPHNLIDITPELIQELSGNYKLVKVTNFYTTEIIDDPITIEVHKDYLELIDVKYKQKFILYFKSENELYGNNQEATILKDENNRVIGLNTILLSDKYELVKID
jgi:hypothetical protein